MDIIIFGGQSNMQGQTEALSESEVVENAYEYKFLSDSLVPLKNPVGENIMYDNTQGKSIESKTDLSLWLKEHKTGSACYGNTNLVPEFCRAYIKETGKELLAVHVAKGSTEIHQWLPGTDGYDILVKKSSAAIKKADKVDKIYFVWLQGESDAIYSKTKAYYKEKITELNEELKKDLEIDKFGVIRVGHFTKDERDIEIIDAQTEICEENPDFLMLTKIATEINQQPEYMNPYVAGHYSAKGLEILGSLSGEALGKFRNK
ncbi:MAG: hypothetical protein IJM97_04680 [Clostridia bacterium]|nr:hypothetical protein [Clostridia bacterium]